MSSRHSSSRRSFLTGTALAGAAALAGCGGDSGAGPSGLRASWYGGAPVDEALRAAVTAFTAKNSGTSVSTEFAPFDDYWDKLATQTAARDAPDVFRMSMSYFTQYAQRGALADLTGAVPDRIDTSSLDEDVATSGEVDGTLFGIGQSSITHAAFTDTTALQALGIAAPQTGWTWPQFGEFARGYAAATPEGVYGTQDAGGQLQIFEVFARQNGSEMFDDDGRFAVGADVVAEWFALWDALRADGAAPPGNVSAEASGFENSVLATGKAPVVFGWVQQITFYQPLVQGTLEVVGVPAGSAGPLEGQFLKALDLWSVSAQSQAPDQAQALVDFLVNDPEAIEAIGVLLGVPPSRAARDQLGADPTTPAGKCIAFVESVQDQVGPSPAAWPPGYREVLDAFSRANEDVAFANATAADAAAAFVQEAGDVSQ